MVDTLRDECELESKRVEKYVKEVRSNEMGTVSFIDNKILNATDT